MIRSINVLSILAFLIAAAAAAYFYVELGKEQTAREGAITSLNATLGARISSNEQAIADLKDAFDKATASQADSAQTFDKEWATALATQETLQKDVDALTSELKQTSDALDAAKTSIVADAVQKINDQMATQQKEAAAAETVQGLNDTIAASKAKLDWMGKFAMLAKDYGTLSCYDSDLFWHIFSGPLLGKEPITDISAEIDKLAAIDLKTLDAKGITSLNTTTQPVYDQILTTLGNANAYIQKKKGGKSAMVDAVKKCGSLVLVGKS